MFLFDTDQVPFQLQSKTSTQFGETNNCATTAVTTNQGRHWFDQHCSFLGSTFEQTVSELNVVNYLQISSRASCLYGLNGFMSCSVAIPMARHFPDSPAPLTMKAMHRIDA
jgi:hypothetical protein